MRASVYDCRDAVKREMTVMRTERSNAATPNDKSTFLPMLVWLWYGIHNGTTFSTSTHTLLPEQYEMSLYKCARACECVAICDGMWKTEASAEHLRRQQQQQQREMEMPYVMQTTTTTTKMYQNELAECKKRQRFHAMNTRRYNTEL